MSFDNSKELRHTTMPEHKATIIPKANSFGHEAGKWGARLWIWLGVCVLLVGGLLYLAFG